MPLVSQNFLFPDGLILMKLTRYLMELVSELLTGPVGMLGHRGVAQKIDCYKRSRRRTFQKQAFKSRQRLQGLFLNLGLTNCLLESYQSTWSIQIVKRFLILNVGLMLSLIFYFRLFSGQSKEDSMARIERLFSYAALRNLDGIPFVQILWSEFMDSWLFSHQIEQVVPMMDWFMSVSVFLVLLGWRRSFMLLNRV